MATIIKKINNLTKSEGEHEKKKDVIKKSNISKKELCLKTFDYFIF